jgi:Ca2+-binding RTX toxin-like protein
MRKGRALIAALALTVPWLATAPAGADSHIPPECQAFSEEELAGFNVIIGTDASERLEGTDGPDFICGLLGDDVIEGGGGDDAIAGDTVTFFGNPQAPGGDDRVTGGPGDDEILPGPGDDRVNGGSGDDFLALAVGDDTGQGGPGVDTIIGGFGRDVVLGGAAADTLVGGQGDDLLNGGPGDDALFGELPPGSPPPPDGVPLPEPGTADRCIGAGGFDVAADCDRVVGVEGDA